MAAQPRVRKAEARLRKIEAISTMVYTHPVLDANDPAGGAWNVRDLSRALKISTTMLNRLISEEESLLMLAAEGKIALPQRGMDPRWRSQITDQSRLVRAANGQAEEAQRRKEVELAEKNPDEAVRTEHITLINAIYGVGTARPRDLLDKLKEATEPAANVIFSNVALKSEVAKQGGEIADLKNSVRAIQEALLIQTGRPVEGREDRITPIPQKPPANSRRNGRRDIPPHPTV